MRNPRIPAFTWAEIRTAYASGIGLREQARNLGIPAETVLARAKREGWTKGIEQAKAKARKPEAKQSNAISVMQSTAMTMTERGQRHVERMAGVVERVLPHVESMDPGAVLDGIERIERLDKVARRTFGIREDVPVSTVVQIAFTGMPVEAR